MAAKTRKRDVNQTQVITAGTNIRFEPSKSSRQPKPKVATVVVQEINPVGGFFDFLRQHAVVGLIIGFVIGTQVQTLVKQLGGLNVTILVVGTPFDQLMAEGLQTQWQAAGMTVKLDVKTWRIISVIFNGCAFGASPSDDASPVRCKPTPGLTRFTASRPMASAAVVAISK